MPNVLVPGAVHADGLRTLAAEPGFTLLPGADIAPHELPTLLACAEAIIVRGTRIDRALLDQAPRLRFVCQHGVGYENGGVPLLTERGITLHRMALASADNVIRFFAGTLSKSCIVNPHACHQTHPSAEC
jgi:phosphoglycerate dehydrogenase-like enzyme